ncbi:MAG TPA: hypothetical protein VFA89_19125 [Terriglobales bacterium]|nr:hypothetical protein [Terriglobales bacterium]
MQELKCRDWREISAEASREKDSKKLLALIDELNYALQKREEELYAAQRRTSFA